MISVRNVLVGLGLAFTGFLVARGLWWTAPVQHPWLMLAALAQFLVTSLLCILWGPPRWKQEAHAARRRAEYGDVGLVEVPGTAARLPVWAAALALAAAAIIPSVTAIAVGPDSRGEAFAAWYIGAIGALMTIVLVRRRPWIAWAGIAVLGIASMAWIGILPALSLGLVGSIMWVAAAQVFMLSMARAARDTAHLAQLQRAASAWQATQIGRQRERRVQVQRALAVAGPVLTRTVTAGGRLTDEERMQAHIAEGQLRDQMRGPRLLDDDVRAELERARRRGATVTVLDEGGLDGLGEAALSDIRRQLAETLHTAGSDRLYIRTSPHERVAVTVVGRSGITAGPSDEDAVDLWREILHPDATPAPPEEGA